MGAVPPRTLPTDDLLEGVRVRLGRSVRTLLSGDGEVRRPSADADDPGWFGPDSVTWIVHADPAMLVGGLRSLLYQTLHPLAMAGVADHSNYREDPLGRLRRTGEFVGITTYGTTAEAETAVEVVRRVHARVRGTAKDGRTYDARDPHLVAWVHCTEVDSFLAAFQRYGRTRLAADEADQYVAEMAVVGEALDGVDLPRSTAALAARLASYDDELAVDRDTLAAVRFLLAPPLPLAVRPSHAVIAAAAVQLLPAAARRRFLLPPMPVTDHLLVRPAARALLATLGWALNPLVTGPEAPAA